jgi:hypothetical protein
MPSFSTTELSIHSDIQNGVKEIDRFRVKAKALGFRKVLSFLPYMTGSKPKFSCEVTRLSNKTNIGYNVSLYRSYARGNDKVKKNLVFFNSIGADIQQKHYKFNFEDKMLGMSGEYSYEVKIHMGVWSEEAEVVAFKAKAQEDVTFSLMAPLFGIVGVLLGVLLTWLLLRGHSHLR